MKRKNIMDNKEIIRELTEKQAQSSEITDSADSIQKFLIFSIDSGKVCFNAELVKEIVLNTTVYFIPFCPPYISGLINRHGDPYTVFDLNVLFENKKQESSKFIIMNEKDDHIAFIIKDIVEIADITQNGIYKIESQENGNEFVHGFIIYKNDKIFIIDLNKILKRLENDL